MTDNIRENEYSSSNEELTNIWNMAMDREVLVRFMIDNIIAKIITNVTIFEHSNIEVNGLGNITGQDSTGFYFDK